MAVRDVLFIGIFLFALGIAFFVIKFASDTAIDKMMEIPAINVSDTTMEVLESTKVTSARADYILLGAFIGLIIALIITGWFIGGYPIFMAIYFLIIIIGVAITPVFSNTWETVTTMPVFGGTLASFPITNHLILNLPIYMAIIGVMGLIVMFGKPYIVGDNVR